MEQFIVSARKYRPQVFEDVVGQQAITKTLENAIKNNHLAQALLFTGPRGVGKTTCARILAKRINQEHLEKVNPDEDFAFNIFELDAASNNSVDDIRSLTDQVRIPPQTGHFKVYIIDEVHMLSQAAFNAFLKTLEEPPAHAIFILATTEKHKIIPTILSRCQIFDFKRIGVTDIKNYLHKIAIEEHIEAEDDALHIIAQKADGALRDALSIFDRVLSFSGTKLTRLDVVENLNVLDYEVYFNMTDLILKHQIPQLLIAYNEVLSKGFEGLHFIVGLASHFRDLLVAKDGATVELLEVGSRAKERYLLQAKSCEVDFLLQAIDLANTCDLNFKSSKNQRLLVELTLMKLASINFNPDHLDEKKKPKLNLIPASFYSQLPEEATKKSSVIVAETNAEYQIEKLEVEVEKQAATHPVKVTKIIDKKVVKALTDATDQTKITGINAIRRTSALSLKSLQEKANLKANQPANKPLVALPETPFADAQFFEVWNEVVTHFTESNQKVFVSVLNANIPKIKGHIIKLMLPNEVMAHSFQKGKLELLTKIRQALNNYKLDFEIVVNEEFTKDYIYTPQEKYQALKKKNPNIEILKKTFKLEL